MERESGRPSCRCGQPPLVQYTGILKFAPLPKPTTPKEAEETVDIIFNRWEYVHGLPEVTDWTFPERRHLYYTLRSYYDDVDALVEDFPQYTFLLHNPRPRWINPWKHTGVPASSPCKGAQGGSPRGPSREGPGRSGRVENMMTLRRPASTPNDASRSPREHHPGWGQASALDWSSGGQLAHTWGPGETDRLGQTAPRGPRDPQSRWPKSLADWQGGWTCDPRTEGAQETPQVVSQLDHRPTEALDQTKQRLLSRLDQAVSTFATAARHPDGAPLPGVKVEVKGALLDLLTYAETGMTERGRCDIETQMAERGRCDRETRMEDRGRCDRETRMADRGRCDRETRMAERGRCDTETRMADRGRCDESMASLAYAWWRQEAEVRSSPEAAPPLPKDLDVFLAALERQPGWKTHPEEQGASGAAAGPRPLPVSMETPSGSQVASRGRNSRVSDTGRIPPSVTSSSSSSTSLLRGPLAGSRRFRADSPSQSPTLVYIEREATEKTPLLGENKVIRKNRRK